MKPRADLRRAADTAMRLTVYDDQRCVGEIEERGRGQIAAHAIDKCRRIEIGQSANRVEDMRAIGGVRGWANSPFIHWRTFSR